MLIRSLERDVRLSYKSIFGWILSRQFVEHGERRKGYHTKKSSPVNVIIVPLVTNVSIVPYVT